MAFNLALARPNDYDHAYHATIRARAGPNSSGSMPPPTVLHPIEQPSHDVGGGG